MHQPWACGCSSWPYSAGLAVSLDTRPWIGVSTVVAQCTWPVHSNQPAIRQMQNCTAALDRTMWWGRRIFYLRNGQYIIHSPTCWRCRIAVCRNQRFNWVWKFHFTVTQGLQSSIRFEIFTLVPLEVYSSVPQDLDMNLLRTSWHVKLFFLQ